MILTWKEGLKVFLKKSYFEFLENSSLWWHDMRWMEFRFVHCSLSNPNCRCPKVKKNVRKPRNETMKVQQFICVMGHQPWLPHARQSQLYNRRNSITAIYIDIVAIRQVSERGKRKWSLWPKSISDFILHNFYFEVIVICINHNSPLISKNIGFSIFYPTMYYA